MRKQIAYPLLLAAVALMAVLLVVPALAAGPGDPDPGTVQGITSYSAYSTVVTGSLATSTSAARRTSAWHAADVFLNVDLDAGAVITVTPQLSWNNSDWVNAEYNYITTTAPLQAGYQIVLSADGGDYIRLPLAGEYLRFSIAHTGTITPTVGVTLRND